MVAGHVGVYKKDLMKSLLAVFVESEDDREKVVQYWKSSLSDYSHPHQW